MFCLGIQINTEPVLAFPDRVLRLAEGSSYKDEDSVGVAIILLRSGIIRTLIFSSVVELCALVVCLD